jgi:lipoprotein LprG
MLKRRLLIGALGLVAAFTVACSSEPLPDGAALLRESAEASKAVKSAHFALAVNGKIDAIPVQRIDGDLTKEGGPGGAAKGIAKVEFGGFLVEGEFVLVDRVLYFKGPTGTFQQLGDASRLYDPSTILDPDKGMAKVLASVSGATTEGTETINDVETYRVAGKVSKDVIAAIVPGVATDVDVKFWLQQEGRHLPVRAWVQLPPAQPGAGASSVELTLSELDKPVTVAKPV